MQEDVWKTIQITYKEGTSVRKECKHINDMDERLNEEIWLRVYLRDEKIKFSKGIMMISGK